MQSTGVASLDSNSVLNCVVDFVYRILKGILNAKTAYYDKP